MCDINNITDHQTDVTSEIHANHGNEDYKSKALIRDKMKHFIKFSTRIDYVPHVTITDVPRTKTFTRARWDVKNSSVLAIFNRVLSAFDVYL